jgi:hypothetical protein
LSATTLVLYRRIPSHDFRHSERNGERVSEEHDIIGRHLGFRNRTVNMLLRGRGYDDDFNPVDGKYPITTMAQLANSTLREVLRIAGAGRHTMRDCEKVLRAHGYTADNSQFLRLIDELVGSRTPQENPNE